MGKIEDVTQNNSGNVLVALDRSKSYRVFLTITTEMAERAARIHQTTPVATAALGRLLTGGGLMGIMMKNENDKLTVQIKGDGPAEELLITAKGDGTVKGYIANPYIDIPSRKDGKLDVGRAVGTGTLTVIKDMGLKEPYMGRIDLVSGEIADDLTAYFFVSEQQSTSVALGVKVDVDGSVAVSAGMIIQMLPDSDPASVDALERMLDTMLPLTSLAEEAGGDINRLLEKIFGGMPKEYRPEILAYRNIEWNCDCSVSRLEGVLLSLGHEELSNIIEEDGQAELICQFCTKAYHFDRQHLERILEGDI
ncbi:MAG: Hsp33 family molecular chaperone HslO [Anaerovoracaceae bacterium]